MSEKSSDLSMDRRTAIVTAAVTVGASLVVGWRTVRLTTRAAESRGSFWPRLDQRQALALGLLAALAALTIHNLTDDLFVHAIEQQFALVLGCLLALRSQNKPRG